MAQDRLRLRSDGRVAVALKTAWHDGTTELVFEPLELLERLAAMTPRPEANLIICHGLLAPHAQWRRSAHLRTHRGRCSWLGRRRPWVASAFGRPRARGAARPRYWSWAALMQRAFAIDVLTCPRCGGRLRLLATVDDPRVIGRILAHRGLTHSGQSPGPAPPEPLAGP